MNRKTMLIAFTCLTVVGGSVVAQKPLPNDPLNDNAALSYWQAFALLPPIDDDTRKRLAFSVSESGSIDDDLRKVVKESENALIYLHRGTSMRACAWGIAGEKGPYAYLPHLSKAREIAHVVLLRARMRFESGETDLAIEDTLSAFQLGRHAGQEGIIVLINILVGFAIESQAIETVANSLHRLDPTQRDRLKREIDEVQPDFDMQAAMQGEKDVFLGWLIREMERGRSGDAILALVSGDTKDRISERVKNASEEQLIRWAKDLGPVYDSAQRIMSGSPSEAKAKAQELVTQLADEATGNPLGELFLPSFGSARQAEARYLTRYAMLDAAFAVFQEGPAALERPELRDPFGDGPFKLVWTEGGAELVSDLPRGDEPMKLAIPGLTQ